MTQKEINISHYNTIIPAIICFILALIMAFKLNKHVKHQKE